jgi:predicted dehydrogenase
MKTAIGIIGMGVMGQTHLKSFQALRKSGMAAVFAVAERDPQKRAGQVSAAGNLEAIGAGKTDLFDGVTGYETPEELLADERIDAVSICTPTDTHVKLAIMALRAGKHVLLEKPVALTVEEVDQVRAAANAAGKICMPAMCMRFWPGWPWLHEAVQSGRYGKVKSAMFTRMGSRPAWGHDFYLNPARSGGALFDLHIHDTDIVYWLFGMPKAVSASGDDFQVTTLYHYLGENGENGPRITATGGWLSSEGFPFRMQYLVEFENAIADWDLTRTPILRVISGGQIEEITLPEGAGYGPEAAEFVAAIAEGTTPPATLEEARDVTRIVLAERRSQRSGNAERP